MQRMYTANQMPSLGFHSIWNSFLLSRGDCPTGSAVLTVPPAGSLPSSSSTVIPKISASCGSRLMSGQDRSFSHLLTACALTPTRSAS